MEWGRKKMKTKALQIFGNKELASIVDLPQD